jgi:glycosyltransferase involved in cell wall biosynthesis
MHVLLLAELCNPRWSSTPFFGYQIARAIATRVDRTTMAVQVRSQRAFTAEDVGVDELVFLDSEYIARPLHRLATLVKQDANKAMTVGIAMSYPSNIAFEWEVWKHFGDRLRCGEFDVVHRVTPLSPTLASPMAKWSPVPFVLGPVNGGLDWPPGFYTELKREREWLTHVRGIHTKLPYYRLTYQKSAAILAGFRHTIDKLPAEAHPRVFDCSDVGYEESPHDDRFERPASDQMTVLFVGRLVPYKCADVLVRAFAQSQLLRKHRLVIVGDGPDRHLLERLILENRLENCVELTGHLPHAEVVARMKQADVFGFPSIRELGAGVVIGAMGTGLPCVLADYGSPGVYGRRGRGVTVPVTDKPALIAGYVRALELLALEPEKRVKLGAAAQSYVRTFHTWSAKAQKIVEVYEWVLGRRQEKPEFYPLDDVAEADPLTGTPRPLGRR